MSGEPEADARSDVRRNRAALLVAARALFGERDDVPMYEVARRAGVGQATLYRHFRDRGSLALALAEESMLAVEQYAAGVLGRPDALVLVLRRSVDEAARLLSVTRAMREQASTRPALELYRARWLSLFRPPLRQAKQEGTVRPEISANDVLLVAQMVQGAMEVTRPDPAGAPAFAARALKLAMRGLTP